MPGDRKLVQTDLTRHDDGMVQRFYRRDRLRPREPVDPSVRASWHAYLKREGQDPERTDWTFLADRFGDSGALADELVQLVLEGRKRATASSVAELEATGQAMPAVGDHIVVLDGRSVARCIVRTTQVDVVPFDEVPRSFAAREGEGDGTLESWRREHWAYYQRVLARHGQRPEPSMPIVCEHFELVFGPRDELAGLVDDD